MDWLKTILTKNLPLKALALSLAFAVWAMLASNTTTEILMNVPIEFRNVPAGMILSADPTEVQLLLRGPRPILRRTRPEEIHLQLDLALSSSGNQQVMALSPQSVEVPAAIEVLQVRPAETRISLTAAEAAVPSR